MVYTAQMHVSDENLCVRVWVLEGGAKMMLVTKSTNMPPKKFPGTQDWKV